MNFIKQLIQILRYRFFLFAGIFPYLLGFAVAYHQTHLFLPLYFFLGFIGLTLVFIGVETFNEYFDYQYGGDRIFQLPPTVIPDYVLWLGGLAFVFAGLIAFYLTFERGIIIFFFALLGFFAAAFYVGPPLRFVYRGLGELVIFFSYGPLMTIGSYYLFTQHLNLEIFLVSLLPGLLIFALCLANEIPDFYQDRLVGKKNIVVRFGQEKAATLYQLTLFAFVLLLGVLLLFRQLPSGLLVLFLLLPLFIRNGMMAKKHYKFPPHFIATIRGTLLLYLLVLSLIIFAYLI